MTLLAAYPLSRRDLYGKGILTFIFTFTMLFSGGLIPSYLLNKALGLVDNRMMLVIAGSMSVYNIIITRTFFRSTLSDEILEATQIDGCDDFNFFLRFVIPLSSTIIASWFCLSQSVTGTHTRQRSSTSGRKASCLCRSSCATS
jgi:multiple sugar transport system permease protein/putative aldouronate transport system permease protein